MEIIILEVVSWMQKSQKFFKLKIQYIFVIILHPIHFLISFFSLPSAGGRRNKALSLYTARSNSFHYFSLGN